MSVTSSIANPEVRDCSDEQIVERILAGDAGLFELLMRRHNQRIYRIVRSIVDDDGEAEDVMQDAYVRAYEHLGQFEGRSTFITWLTRIAMHEAFARAQRLKRQTSLDSDEVSSKMKLASSSTASPEKSAATGELRVALEAAILALPPKYRSVIMTRDVEEMTTAEAAATLELSEDLVKVRLHRARALVRRALFRQSGQCARDLFPFQAPRCNRVVAGVMARISEV
jgi:RNA polymerase sigma-70 factor (ECF subfamily)